MSQAIDLNDEVASLQKEVAETRKLRMAAQKAIAAKPVLEVAVERASRNRSSGSTDETDALRKEINSLRTDTTREVTDIDRVRRLFVRADPVFKDLPGRAQLLQKFSDEARWRDEILNDGKLHQVRLAFPQSMEVK